MRKIYIAYSESHGECEGAFDQDGTLLDFWSCNDGCWSTQFSIFMQKLGFQIETNCPNWIIERLEAAVLAEWGDCFLE